jgi:hypothetical protein
MKKQFSMSMYSSRTDFYKAKAEHYEGLVDMQNDTIAALSASRALKTEHGHDLMTDQPFPKGAKIKHINTGAEYIVHAVWYTLGHWYVAGDSVIGNHVISGAADEFTK